MKIRTCGRCGADTWLAVDPPLDVVLDPQPLPTPMAELGAVLAGHATYTVHRNGDTHLRHPLVIRARPAGQTPRQQVLQDHRCQAEAGRETMSR
jgi:hypothetical protein